MAHTEPRLLASKSYREAARRIRDGQWRHMEDLRESGGEYWRAFGGEGNVPAGVVFFGFLLWQDMAAWLHEHHDWFNIGDFDTARGANPIALTAAGLRALENRQLYDMDPVFGGAVEPGWTAIPTPSPAAPATEE